MQTEKTENGNPQHGNARWPHRGVAAAELLKPVEAYPWQRHAGNMAGNIGAERVNQTSLTASEGVHRHIQAAAVQAETERHGNLVAQPAGMSRSMELL